MPLNNPGGSFDIDVSMGLRSTQDSDEVAPGGDNLTMESADPLTTEGADNLTTES